jgi:hypothetical protein
MTAIWISRVELGIIRNAPRHKTSMDSPIPMLRAAGARTLHIEKEKKKAGLVFRGEAISGLT